MQIVVDKLLTRYELSGRGRLVLLLHGWGDDHRTFDDLRKKLDPKYRVLALDLPGFGGTERPAGVWNLDDYAGFVKAALDKLQLEQPYAIVGHSNGGALAIRAVSLNLLRPRKLALLAASGVRTNNRAKRFFFKAVAKTGNAATVWLPERYRQTLRKGLYGMAGSDMLAVPELKDTFKKTVRQDVQADAAAINVPTLLIYAADDDYVPLADGRHYLSLIKGSRLEVVANAGHFVHHDQPGQVTKLIEEFLK